MPSRQLACIAAVAATIGITACTTGHSARTVSGPGRSESGTSAAASPRPSVLISASSSAHLYRGTETFCLRRPLSGTAEYSVHAGIPHLALDLHGLPPNTGVGLDWVNNAARGYMVGTFTTDPSGTYIGAARMFRLGEVRAVAIRFQREDGTGLAGVGKPC